MENTDERNKKMHGLHLPAATTTIIKILEHMCIVKYKHTHICMYITTCICMVHRTLYAWLRKPVLLQFNQPKAKPQEITYHKCVCTHIHTYIYTNIHSFVCVHMLTNVFIHMYAAATALVFCPLHSSRGNNNIVFKSGLCFTQAKLTNKHLHIHIHTRAHTRTHFYKM